MSKFTPEDITEITQAVISNIKENFFLVPLTKNFDFRKESDFIDYVIFETANYFQVNKDLLISPTKLKVIGFDYSYSQVRYIIMKLCRIIPERPISYPIIAETLKLKNHTSILYGVRMCDDHLKDKTMTAFKYDFEQIQNKIVSNIELKKMQKQKADKSGPSGGRMS